MKLGLNSGIGAFLKAQGGGLSVMTAVAAVGVVAAAGLALDYGRGHRVASGLQEIADGATLFAASARDVTGSDDVKASKRKKFAQDYLDAKLADLSDVEIIGTPTISSSDETITLTLNGRVRGSFVNVMNDWGKNPDGKTISVQITSAASFGSDAYSCMLALNPTVHQALSFTGNATLLGVDCRVHANSNNAVAINLQGAASLTASEICAVGGASGAKYTPTPTHCPAYPDPYAGLSMPTAAASCTAAFTNVTVKNATKNLTPGTYCGGIAVQTGGIANLAPGLYIIKDGLFSAAANSTINAPSGVTVYLTGAASKINIVSGAILTLKAPTSATANSSTLPYKGMAFMQDATSGIGNVNQIASKGGVNIEGVFYTPAHSLSITANGTMNANSKFFPVIVNTLAVGGTGELYIKFDFAAAGFDNPVPLMTKGKVSLIQ